MKEKRLYAGYSLEDIFNSNHTRYISNHTRKRLIKEGILKGECSKCGFTQKSDGFELSVCELHHINGNSRDHRLDNLEILCPNCHALIPNYLYVSISE